MAKTELERLNSRGVKEQYKRMYLLQCRKQAEMVFSHKVYKQVSKKELQEFIDKLAADQAKEFPAFWKKLIARAS